MRAHPHARTLTVCLALLAISLPLAGLAGSPTTHASTDQGPAWSNDQAPATARSWGVGGSPQVLVTSTWDDGTYRSLDGGLSWGPIEGFPPVGSGLTVWDPSDPEVGYVAGSGGVAKTEDGGLTWTHALEVSRAYRLHVGPDGAVLVGVAQLGGDRTVLASTDGLETVEDLEAPIPDFISIHGVAYGPTPDHVVVTTVGTHHWTDDGGATWTRADGGGELVTDGDGTIYRTGPGSGADPPGGVLRSTDGGASWEQMTTPLSVRELEVGPGGSLWALTVDGLLLSQGWGQAWVNLGFGVALFSTTDLLVDPGDPEAVLATTEDIGVARVAPDQAGTYTFETRNTGFPPVDLWSLGASGDGSLLLAGGPVGLYASRDGGQHWSHTTAGIGFPGVRSTTANPDGSVVYSAGRNFVFHPLIEVSQDGGQTWEAQLPQLGGSGTVLGLASHPTDGDRAFAAVWMELVPSHVLETTDGGRTWTSILEMDPKIFDVAWDTAEQTILAATELGVLAYDPSLDAWTPRSVSTDASRSVDAAAGVAVAGGTPATLWRSSSPGFPYVPAAVAATTGFLDAVAIDPVDGSEAWAATDGGELHRCGITLTEASVCTATTPPGGGVQDVLVTPDGQQVLAASTGGGLWQAPLDR